MSKKSKKKSRRKKSHSGSNNSTKKPVAQQPSSKKMLPTFIIAAVVIIIAGFVYYSNSMRVDDTETAKQIASGNIDALRGRETRETLSPTQFVGKTARTYNIALENRDLMDSMYCYCNCKKNLGHKSLLTCFVTTHAINCNICQDQALYAYSQYQKNPDLVKVRTAVDRKFWRPLR